MRSYTFSTTWVSTFLLFPSEFIAVLLSAPITDMQHTHTHKYYLFIFKFFLLMPPGREREREREKEGNIWGSEIHLIISEQRERGKEKSLWLLILRNKSKSKSKIGKRRERKRTKGGQGVCFSFIGFTIQWIHITQRFFK